MKNILKILFLSFFLLGVFSCQDSGLFESSTDQERLNLVEDEVIKILDKDKNFQVSYPLFGEICLYWNADSGYYEEGTIYQQDGTKFRVKRATVVPPSELFDDFTSGNISNELKQINELKKPVKITMRIDKDEQNNELIYTFGPHGTKFTKPARIAFDYSSLGTETAQLFYIEDDGSYKEQAYDSIDIKNRKIYLYINHFSRYAMSYGK